MSGSEAANLGDIKQIYIEPFPDGKKALLVFEVMKKISIDGNSTQYAGAVLAEKQLMELGAGLSTGADMRQSAEYAERIIKV